MPRKQSRARDEDEKKEVPWGAIVIAVAVMVAAMGWCVMASAYVADVQGIRPSGNIRDIGNPRTMILRSFGRFIGNGFTQLPNLPAVVGYVVTERFWIVLAILGVEAVVIVAGLFLFKLDNALSKEPTWKKSRKLATPKREPDDVPKKKTKKKPRTLPPPGYERRRREQ